MPVSRAGEPLWGWRKLGLRQTPGGEGQWRQRTHGRLRAGHGETECVGGDAAVAVVGSPGTRGRDQGLGWFLPKAARGWRQEGWRGSRAGPGFESPLCHLDSPQPLMPPSPICGPGAERSSPFAGPLEVRTGSHMSALGTGCDGYRMRLGAPGRPAVAGVPRGSPSGCTRGAQQQGRVAIF